MKPIQHIRRFAGVLAGLAAALVAFGATPAFATTAAARAGAGAPPGPVALAAGRGVPGSGRCPGPHGGPHGRHRRHARLADHPDRRRGRPARGHGGGARGPGASQPPEGSHCGRLSHAANEAAPASDSMTTVVLAPLTR